MRRRRWLAGAALGLMLSGIALLFSGIGTGRAPSSFELVLHVRGIPAGQTRTVKIIRTYVARRCILFVTCDMNWLGGDSRPKQERLEAEYAVSSDAPTRLGLPGTRFSLSAFALRSVELRSEGNEDGEAASWTITLVEPGQPIDTRLSVNAGEGVIRGPLLQEDSFFNAPDDLTTLVLDLDAAPFVFTMFRERDGGEAGWEDGRHASGGLSEHRKVLLPLEAEVPVPVGHWLRDPFEIAPQLADGSYEFFCNVVVLNEADFRALVFPRDIYTFFRVMDPEGWRELQKRDVSGGAVTVSFSPDCASVSVKTRGQPFKGLHLVMSKRQPGDERFGFDEVELETLSPTAQVPSAG